MGETFAASAAAQLAVVERGGFVESRHVGSAVVLGPDGEVVRDLGDTSAPVLPRSSMKPFQALAVMTSGVTLRGEDAAIATASHSGTPQHVALVRGLLARVALPASALRCPAEVVRARRQRLQREAKKKGRPIGAARWQACRWTVLVTNVPAETLTAPEALIL